MVSLNNVVYTFGGKINALDGVNANFGPGIHLLMGANGAGKTTLLHLIAGLRRPQQGECLIDGDNVAKRRPETMRRIFMLDETMIWPAKTMAELVKSHAIFYPNFSMELLENNLKEVGLSLTDNIEAQSLGNRKRAAIAYAVALKPDVLLLDEPANGLDINGRGALKRIMLHGIDEHQTVIVSTHTVWDVQSLIEGVTIMAQGHIVLNLSIEHLCSRLAFVTSPSHRSDAIYEESGLGGFEAIIPNDGSMETDVNYTLLYKAMHDVRSLPALLNALNIEEK